MQISLSYAAPKVVSRLSTQLRDIITLKRGGSRRKMRPGQDTPEKDQYCDRRATGYGQSAKYVSLQRPRGHHRLAKRNV
jgi:hypothetical protein